jgi:hypothetical protein
MLDRARAALAAGDTARALAALDEHARATKASPLAAEATLLRIQVLARAGQAAKADELARRFVEADPGSTLAERAREFQLPASSASSRSDLDAGPAEP